MIAVLLCKVMPGLTVLLAPTAQAGERVVEICTPEGPRFFIQRADQPLPPDALALADCPWLALGPLVLPTPAAVVQPFRAHPAPLPLPRQTGLIAQSRPGQPANRGPPRQS